MMELDIYNSIIKSIKNFRGLTKDCIILLYKQFPEISKETLQSILSTEYQKLMRVNYRKDNETIEQVYKRFIQCGKDDNERTGVINKLSLEFNVSPSLIAKLILLKKYKPHYEDETALQNFIGQCLKDSSIIDDGALAYEIFLCTMFDDQYSSLSEVIKTSLGQQYEIHIARQLSMMGVAYRDEEWLRKFGYDKTPDFKLDVPVEYNGFIIHWIESKALFGDEETHNDYIKNQYSSYWNRFGPGLVIYWFDYLDCICKNTPKNLMILNYLPHDFTQIGKDATL